MKWGNGNELVGWEVNKGNTVLIRKEKSESVCLKLNIVAIRE